MNSITPGGGTARVVRTAEESTLRGTSSVAASALSATSCQEVSPSRGVPGLGCARKDPAPGRVTTSPSAESWASARETVTGETR